MIILLLAAGKGKRFTDVGYPPKPLINVNGKPMWLAVLENLVSQIPSSKERYEVLIATKEEYQINSDDYKVINLNGPQFGAAYSALEVLKKFPSEKELLILNVDQFIEFNWQSLGVMRAHCDGGLLHFHEPNGEYKWGRSVVGQNAFLINAIVEKIPVSDLAHTGHYYFRSVNLFIKYASKLIEMDFKFNNEYFLSPIYNLMIADGLKIGGVFVDKFIPIGIPEELEQYINKL